jgi:hypothetical protein
VRSDSLPARISGVLRSPRATCETLAAKPRWADVLVVTFLVAAGISAVLLETQVGRLALLDQWERTAVAFGQPVDDRQYAAMERASEGGAVYAVLSTFVSGPVLVFGVSAVLFLVFRTTTGASVSYRQILSVAAHAGVILMLRQVVAAPVVYARESLASPLTLGLFISNLDEASPLARFLATVDLFVVWWMIVLAIGMSVLYRRPARRLVFVFAGAYVLLAAVLTTVMALTGGTA